MHRFRLSIALLAASMTALATGTTLAAPACPRVDAAVTERFISADCADCWAAAAQGPATAGWLFDWITPTPHESDAALAAAALAEARERAQRVGAEPPAGGEQQVQRQRQARPPRVTLQVQSGPAWNGYFGLQFDVRGTLPAGSTGWLALVELLPAASEGSPIERQLVRSVAGPLPLDGARSPRGLRHLRALRWPETARPTRLQARGWVEGPDGRMLVVAADRCAPR